MQRRIDARRFPTIDGVLREVVSIGDNGEQRVRGEVTFRGETRTCEDVVTITAANGGIVSVEGRSTFDIRDFGMDPPRILMLRVEPEVDVEIAITAERES